MRFFNTEGPIRPANHYHLPPLSRWDMDEIELLIDQQKYFLLHAPRQTGKTSCLLALMEHLNHEGHYRAVYANLETSQVAREDVALGVAGMVHAIANAARLYLKDTDVQSLAREVLGEQSPTLALQQFLARWCENADRPIVLLLDEVDALIGDTLISLLRQLRAGYNQRPEAFPQTVILCGVRDLRDYRIHASSEAEPITGGSAFNIKAASLRLGDFSAEETRTLLLEHTADTGQAFTEDALARVWELTQGQPWLVNALAYRVTFENKALRDRTLPITRQAIDAAKEHLIINRVTHLDQLAHKLEEPRVRRIIEPMLAGTEPDWQAVINDRDYLVDLGLLRRDGTGVRVANPIYHEVLPRMLASGPQDFLPQITPSWLDAKGNLDPDRLLGAFLTFWRQHGEPMLKTAPYHEIAPHLVLMAFLHRVVNGEGVIEREYAIGAGRMDLMVRYRDRVLGMELKVWRDGRADPLNAGLTQIDPYLAGLGLDTGWLVIFDRRSGQPPIEERTRCEPATTPAGRHIQVIRA